MNNGQSPFFYNQMGQTITERIREFITLPSVKIVSVALALNMLLQYALDDVILDLKSIVVAFIAVGISAYLAGLILRKNTYINIFIMGVVSYFGYIWSLLFFKLTEIAPSFESNFQSAVMFGGLSIVVYWAIDNFGS